MALLVYRRVKKKKNWNFPNFGISYICLFCNPSLKGSIHFTHLSSLLEYFPQDLKTLCSKAGADCAARGVELGKLSVHHNITTLADSVATTLLGVGRMEILKINLDIVMEGLSAVEREVMEEIKEKYFSGLTDTSWDYTEIEEYNKAINS